MQEQEDEIFDQLLFAAGLGSKYVGRSSFGGAAVDAARSCFVKERYKVVLATKMK